MKKIIYLFAIGISISSCDGGVNGCECGKNEMKDNVDKELVQKCHEHFDGLNETEKREFLNDRLDCAASESIEN